MSLRVALVAALAFASGCSLIVKSDDLLGGTKPEGDGGVAASGSDAGGALAACGGKTVCDDFEGGGTIPWSSDMRQQSGNATIGVDGVRARGGAKSLHAARPQASGRDSAVWGFHLDSALRFCEFDVYATSTTADNVVAVKISFEKPATPYDSYFVSLEMGGGFEQYGAHSGASPFDTGQFARELGYGAWKHVRLAIERSPAPHLTVTVDGNAIPDFPMTPPSSAPTFVELGVVYQAVAGVGSEVFFDNVACTRE